MATEKTKFDPKLIEELDEAYLHISSSMQNSTEATMFDARLLAETGGVVAGGLAIWGGKIVGRRTALKESPQLKKAAADKTAAEKAYRDAQAKRAAYDSHVTERMKAANRDIAAAKRSGDSAALKRAQAELKKAEAELKKIERRADYQKAVQAENAAKKAQTSARGNYKKVLKKYPPQPGSKLLPRAMKGLGWLAVGSSAISFADHMIDYLTDDRSFYHTDENGNRELVDPKVLTAGSQSAGAQVLFSGKYDAMARIMAVYAAKHGLGNQVTPEKWMEYVAHMGEGTKFSLESEVQLRQTLLKAYQQLSKEEKLMVLDEVIKEQSDPELIASLNKLKDEVEREESAKENAPQQKQSGQEKDGGTADKKPVVKPTPAPEKTEEEPDKKPGETPKRKRGAVKGSRPRGTVKGSRPKSKPVDPNAQGNVSNTLRGAGYDISGQTSEMGQTRTLGGRGGMA